MRIIAGAYKGRNLLSPEGMATRPITGLAKKSLFDSLGPRLDGALVVDLYCGTGTIGLEAMSRGARSCCFADISGSAVRLLRKNIEMLGVEAQCRVWQGDVTARLAAWLGELDGNLDLAFVDPPYEQSRAWDWAAVEQRIFAPLAAKLAADGLVILRVPSDADVPGTLGPLAEARRKRYGDMELVWFALGAPETNG